MRTRKFGALFLFPLLIVGAHGNKSLAVEVGFQLKPGFSWVSDPDDEISISRTGGFNDYPEVGKVEPGSIFGIEGGAFLSFMPISILTLQPGVAFSTRGFELDKKQKDSDGSGDYVLDIRYRANYVSFQMPIRCMLFEGVVATPNFIIGPNFSILISSSFDAKEKYVWERRGSSGESSTEWDKEDFISEETNANFGTLFGLGIDFPVKKGIIQIDLLADFTWNGNVGSSGVLLDGSEEKYMVYHRNLSLSVGFRFGP